MVVVIVSKSCLKSAILYGIEISEVFIDRVPSFIPSSKSVDENLDCTWKYIV